MNTMVGHNFYIGRKGDNQSDKNIATEKTRQEGEKMGEKIIFT
jgi:endo-1,4-beta-mannosidase